MRIVFDQPALLLLGLLVIPLAALTWRWLSNMDRLRRATVVGLRSAVLLGLAVMLAGPRLLREHDQLTVIGVLDLSRSVQRFAALPEVGDVDRASAVEFLRRWFRIATATRAPDDRFGLVVFDGRATVISVPVRGEYVDDNLDVQVLDGTNIAAGIRMALAMFPADTGRRIVLATDGNETSGEALRAAREAAAGGAAAAGGTRAARSAVPIDVVPIDYLAAGDVQIVRLESPPAAQPGATVTVRIVLEATAPARGRLVLRREGEPVDLNGAQPGTSRLVTVPAGQSVEAARVVLGESPINRFEAVFEPAEPGFDAILDNNLAESFTATAGRGSALVLDAGPDPQANVLARAMSESGIPATAELPTALPNDLLSLQRYDLIVLDDVAATDLSRDQHELLARWVNDLGGGLIMVGGERSFGAGGWNGTALERVLPLELDPPKELRLASAALVLVLDKSGSMNRHVAGARTSQQRIANEAAAMAIESLRAESLVGVVTFDFFAHLRVPLQRNDDPKRIAELVRGISSDGGTNLEPALRMAYGMLSAVDAERKLVVCLTDGRSESGDLENVARTMAASGIRLTTIAVGNDADEETLRRLAELGGGEHYAVRNPRTLPRVLVDSVRAVNRPLVKEGVFSPVARPTGSTLSASMQAAPDLQGLVITSARPDASAVVEATHPDGEPLLAQWQVGLGRAAAFTSDAGGPWSARWLDWPGFAPFWAQLARTISRPPVSPDTELVTMISDDRLRIELDAADRERGFLDYLSVDGVVYSPDGTSTAVRMRQTAPGRAEASVPAAAPGNYVVALSPRRGDRRLAPVIGGVSQPASPEFRRFESDAALLDEIAEATGGRRLDLAAPQDADRFDRSGMAPSRAALPAWPLVLWVTLGLLLADVAGRRLAWDAGLLRRAARRALARVTPSALRGREAAEALSALKGTRPARAIPPRVARKEALPPTAPPPPPVQASPSAPSTVASALDALQGRPGRRERPQEPPPKEPADAARPAGTTGSLLEARRRARKRVEGEGTNARREKGAK